MKAAGGEKKLVVRTLTASTRMPAFDKGGNLIGGNALGTGVHGGKASKTELGWARSVFSGLTVKPEERMDFGENPNTPSPLEKI